MASPLSTVVCGDMARDDDLCQVLTHISESISFFYSQVLTLDEKPSQEITMFGPFIGRSLLELSVTALIARFDPFRVLLLREVQRQNVSDLGKRRRCAIQWDGDVVASEPPSPTTLWSSDKTIDKFTRALLSDYYDHIYWRSAFTKVIDEIEEYEGCEWVTSLKTIEPKEFTPLMKGYLQQTFSALSKGVHHEFMLPPEQAYDRTTVLKLVTDAVRLTTQLGLVSHKVLHCPCTLEFSDVTPLVEELSLLEAD